MTNGHPNFPVLILLGARASPVTANSSPRNVIVIPLTISAEPEDIAEREYPAQQRGKDGNAGSQCGVHCRRGIFFVRRVKPQ